MTASIRALLEGVIDYAGLFPPAELPMAEAVANYARYRDGEYAWMLARFVVPHARWDEYLREGSGGWPVAVLGEPIAHESVEAVESPEAQPFGDLEVYREVAVDAPVAGLGVRAKIRTGPVAPSSAALAGFIVRCVEAGVPFKATAGLHHPLRNPPAHGFINLAAAAVFPDSAEAVLDETDSREFAFVDDWMRWGTHSATVAEIRAARRERFISFGSCSFEEPIADLKELGWL